MDSSIVYSAAIKSKLAPALGREKQLTAVLVNFILNNFVLFCANIGTIIQYVQYEQ